MRAPQVPSPPVPTPVLRAVESGDLAAHHEAVEPGPSPVVRALVGLLLGAALGALAALVIPRRRG